MDIYWTSNKKERRRSVQAISLYYYFQTTALMYKFILTNGQFSSHFLFIRKKIAARQKGMRFFCAKLLKISCLCIEKIHNYFYFWATAVPIQRDQWTVLFTFVGRQKGTGGCEVWASSSASDGKTTATTKPATISTDKTCLEVQTTYSLLLPLPTLQFSF